MILVLHVYFLNSSVCNLVQHVFLVDINNMDQLMLLLEPVVSRWELFGLQLGISDYKLRTIKNDSPSDDNLRKLFSLWIDINDDKAYFEDLVKALRQPAICNNALALRIVRDEEIIKRFGKDSHIQSNSDNKYLLGKQKLVLSKQGTSYPC